MFQFFHVRHLPTQKVVLLTGSAGVIGMSLQHELGKDYHFRCLDNRKVPHSPDFRRVNITNFKTTLSNYDDRR